MNGFKGSRMTRLATVGFLALMTCGVASGVRAQEEGELVKNVLGKIGLIPEDKDPIQYRERAPLVLPPKAGYLPPPAESGYGERQLSNWPKDPDVAASRERAASATTPRTQTEEWRANQGDARVSPEKLRSTRSAGRDPNDRTPVNAPNPKMNSSGWINPDDLRATASKYKDGSTPPGGEPTRETLSDPPTGYRKATAPAKQTYDPPDLMDPASPYYMEHMRRKQAEE